MRLAMKVTMQNDRDFVGVILLYPLFMRIGLKVTMQNDRDFVGVILL